MMAGVVAAGEAQAQARVVQVADILGEALAQDLPQDVDISVQAAAGGDEMGGQDLVLSGGNLAARYASDARLYGLGITAQAILR
jgi:hypothetical protein